jgi:hypothetical protein
MNLFQRMLSPTPDFFKKLRVAGLALAAVSAALVAAPIALPVVIIHIAGYLAVAGGVVTAVSQAAVKNDS